MLWRKSCSENDIVAIYFPPNSAGGHGVRILNVWIRIEHQKHDQKDGDAHRELKNIMKNNKKIERAAKYIGRKRNFEAIWKCVPFENQKRREKMCE